MPPGHPKKGLEMAAREAAARTARGYLVEQIDAGSRHALSAETTTIGRDPQNSIVLGSKGVSRLHAEVRWNGTQYVLHDLGSHNGTYLNGEHLTVPRPLRDGDLLLFGGMTLAFESDETQDWAPELVAHAAVRIDLAGAQVWVGERPVRLTTQEYRALGLLYGRRGTLVTKEELVQHLWPEYQGGVADDTIAQLMSRLRRKLGEDPDHPHYLHTVRGLGYRLLLS
jgi:DNA-binding response OmpR family regulator